MNEKRRNAPASPEEERAQLRQLTRELHEAAQDARDAAREVRQARAEIVKDLDAKFSPILDSFQSNLQSFVDRQIELLSGDVRKIQGHIQQSFAELMKANSPSELMDLIIEQTKVVVLNEVRTIADQQRKGKGQVLVATQEQLDDFVAAGGDPGFIIDARA